MEKVQFDINIPQQVALKYAGPGKEFPSQKPGWGPSVMYTLADERVMWLHPAVAAEIDKLQFAAGEVFRICKREVRDGQKKTVRFFVERLDASRELNGLSGSVQATSPEISLTAASTQAPNGQPNHTAPKLALINGHAAAQAEQADAVKLVQATQLASALKTAVAAAAMVEEFAKSISYSVHFNSEDIRCMANTVLIGFQRNGNGNGGH